jgi:hypothetical protein
MGVRPDGDWGSFVTYDLPSGDVRFTLPGGLVTADAKSYFSARSGARQERTTTIRRYDPRTGELKRTWSVRGRWWLSGVSPTGRWIALTSARSNRLLTTLGIMDTTVGRVGRIVRLKGSFEVETLSADGRRLFLLQHLSGNRDRYLVRLYDVSRGRLRDGSLRGKGEPQVMTGFAWNALASPDGRWLLTLYVDVGRNAAFVHALDLESSKPRCISLPSRRHAFEALRRYSLTLSRDGTRLYAANPALGAVAEIDLRALEVVRTARFRPEPVPLRKLPQTTNGAIARDGRTLYFTGARAVWAFDAATGSARGPYPAGGPVIGLAFGERERSLFAIRADRTIVGFDAATGKRLRA